MSRGTVIRTLLFLALFAYSLGALAGCGADAGSPPTITNLTITPSTIDVGKQSTITAAFTFEDPDGDPKEVSATLTLPGGQSQAIGSTPLQNANGQTSGPVQMILVLSPPVEGTYTLSLVMRDEQGNASGPLTGPIEAKAP